MALHIVRDFISQLVSTPVASMYFTAIFLRTVMNFTVIGHTNFDLDGSLTIDSGTAGAISAADGFTNRFTPDGYTVSSSDIDRILVIKSTNNPQLTSGLWRIVGVDTINNQFILGLRGEPPVIESGLTWRLHPAETSVSLSNGTNGNTGQYRGRTSASSTSRIIMQSPHSSAWQVRLTYETATDYSTSIRSKFTIAPGFGGDSIGDFPVGGDHLHGALWANISGVDKVVGLTVGYGAREVTAITRYYMWGEDSTGTCVFVTRGVTNNTTESFAAFGLPEDEQYPNDARLVRRLFVWGVNRTSSGEIKFSTGQSQSGYPNLGTAFGYSGQPISCSASCYGYMSGQQFPTNGPYYNANGADNPFLAVTELLTVDLFAGTWDHGDYSGQEPSIFMEPRRLGRFPIARIGRSNFGDFTTSTDGARTWIHTRNGVYLPWSGAILP